jgi:uncharacterized protein YqeY
MKDMGSIMNLVKKEFGDGADMVIASKIAREEISKNNLKKNKKMLL